MFNLNFDMTALDDEVSKGDNMVTRLQKIEKTRAPSTNKTWDNTTE